RQPECIIARRRVPRRGMLRGESTAAIAEENSERIAAAGPDDQIFVTVPVEIHPGHAGPETRELTHEQRLAFEFVERKIVMPMPQVRGHIAEKWGRRFRRAPGWRTSPPGGARDGLVLVHLVNAIRLGVGHEALRSTAPGHFDSQLVRE